MPQAVSSVSAPEFDGPKGMALGIHEQSIGADSVSVFRRDRVFAAPKSGHVGTDLEEVEIDGRHVKVMGELADVAKRAVFGAAEPMTRPSTGGQDGDTSCRRKPATLGAPRQLMEIRRLVAGLPDGERLGKVEQWSSENASLIEPAGITKKANPPTPITFGGFACAPPSRDDLVQRC